MEGLIERYRKASGESQTEGGEVNQAQVFLILFWSSEIITKLYHSKLQMARWACISLSDNGFNSGILYFSRIYIDCNQVLVQGWPGNVATKGVLLYSTQLFQKAPYYHHIKVAYSEKHGRSQIPYKRVRVGSRLLFISLCMIYLQGVHKIELIDEL